MILRENVDTSDEMDKNCALLLVGDMFSHICQHGSIGAPKN